MSHGCPDGGAGGKGAGAVDLELSEGHSDRGDQAASDGSGRTCVTFAAEDERCSLAD